MQRAVGEKIYALRPKMSGQFRGSQIFFWVMTVLFVDRETCGTNSVNAAIALCCFDAEIVIIFGFNHKYQRRVSECSLKLII